MSKINKIRLSGQTYDVQDLDAITQIKTINNQSLIGEGNIDVQGGSVTVDPSLDSGSTNPVANSAITTAINAKANTSDVFITSANRNSIVSNIHEEVYQLSSDDIYSITATKGNSGDTIWCQIMVDNVLYTMSGSSTSITYSDTALANLVTVDFSSSMSVTLNDRENHHINEIFFECYNDNDNSYIKEITITHNPPIGANKIDYVASIYTEFVHDKYAHKIDLNAKQDKLVSGTNIKTINNQSILGEGNITIQGGGGSNVIEVTQAEYDALVQAGTLDLTAIYIITDSAGGDFTDYYTKAQVNTLLEAKASTATTDAINATLTAHTANTSIHVTTAQTTAWDAKSDFSGDYEDLTNKPTIPTVPTSNTAFTNDAGYQTATDVANAISGKADTTAVTEVNNTLTAHTADTDIHVTTAQTAAWNAKQDALSNASTLSGITSQNVTDWSTGASNASTALSKATANETALGGLKLVQITQSDYDALSTKDSSTLYVIVN